MPNASKYLENPLPYLQEAQKSASKILELEKKLLRGQAKTLAIHQIKKTGLLAGAVLFVLMALFFCLGWVSVALHEAGWGAGTIALVCLILFTLIAGVFAYLFMRSFKSDEDDLS